MSLLSPNHMISRSFLIAAALCALAFNQSVAFPSNLPSNTEIEKRQLLENRTRIVVDCEGFQRIRSIMERTVGSEKLGALGEDQRKRITDRGILGILRLPKSERESIRSSIGLMQSRLVYTGIEDAAKAHTFAMRYARQNDWFGDALEARYRERLFNKLLIALHTGK